MVWNFPFVKSVKCLKCLAIGAGGPGFGSQYPWWVAHNHLWLHSSLYTSGLHGSCSHVHITSVPTCNMDTQLKIKSYNQSAFASWGIAGFGFSHQGCSAAHPWETTSSLSCGFLPHPALYPHLYKITHRFSMLPFGTLTPILFCLRQESEAKPLRAPW